MINLDGSLRKFWLSLVANDLVLWIAAIAFVLVIINIILEVFYDNSK